MSAIKLRAHYDGHRILLDDPFDLPVNAALIVTVLSIPENERDNWLNLSAIALSAAYSDDEPEYSLIH